MNKFIELALSHGILLSAAIDNLQLIPDAVIFQLL